MIENVAIEHFADKPEGLVQRCARCGEIISDNRNVMIHSPDGDYSPTFWAEGKIYKLGNYWSTREFDSFRPCNPS